TTTLTPASAPFQTIPVGLPHSPNPGYDPLVVGDFNGDGIADLAAMDGVHVGLGDGTFREPPVGLGLSAANPNLVCMVSGDFNGDGKLDLVVAPTHSSDIAMLLGNGDGSFQAPMFSSVGTRAFRPGPLYSDPETLLAAGDFNGDSYLDLTVA